LLHEPGGRSSAPRIGVVVPAYRVSEQVLGVLGRIGPEVDRIYLIDDACPEKSGEIVTASVSDPRIEVVVHDENRGVGGAVKTGCRLALRDKCDIVVKLDGDGQMDPADISRMIEPIVDGRADYVKGNRFYYSGDLTGMPRSRKYGNAALSIITKFSTGYYETFDPTNGYTAINATALRLLNLDRVADRYLFETSILFQLSLISAVVEDVPMSAVYGDETSSLRVSRSLFSFAFFHVKNTVRRIWYRYFVRDFGPASILLVFGSMLMVFGTALGAYFWIRGISTGRPTTSGSVMLTALPLILGYQSLMTFLQYDIGAVPRRPLSSFPW
jgi:dolichol-phosphate mannosyltransferase